MNIAVLANNEKKELLLQFCIGYKDCFSGHRMLTSFSSGSKLDIAMSGKTSDFEYSGSLDLGQISTKIVYNEIDAVIFFRDPTAPFDDVGASLVRLCDVHNVPLATNVATATVIMNAIKNGEIKSRSGNRPYETAEL